MPTDHPIDEQVTSINPDSPMQTTGTDHITLVGSNTDDTIEFYRDILGMPLVLSQPNLDRPEVHHLFFDTGDGRILTFFVHEDRDSNTESLDPDVGAVHHLAFSIEADRLNEVKTALEDAEYTYTEFDRGAFHSLYTRDHNGLTIELVVDKYAIPDDRRGEVLARAHHHRLSDGAEYVDDEHMQAALDDLELDVEPAVIPDAPTGAGVDE